LYPNQIDLGSFTLPILGEVRLTLPSYGVMFALGAIAAWFWFMRRGRTLGIDDDVLFNLGFWSLVAGLLGAKLALIAVEWRYYLENPWEILGTLRSAGVLLGGVLAGAVTFLLYARRHRLPVTRLADAAAAPLALGQAVGRLGCFSAGCCYGVPASQGSPFAVTFSNPEAHAHTDVPLGIPLVPIQLIQMASDLALAALLTVLWRRSRRPGVTAWSYVVLYGLARTTLENWRGDATRGLWFGGSLSTSQIVGLAGAAIGALALARQLTRPLPEGGR
jgi:phosphatidylglycerol:prolipoprotein diacylglycerol transferase